MCMTLFHLGILLLKLQVEVLDEQSTDSELLNLELDGLEHLVGYICKKIKNGRG